MIDGVEIVVCRGDRFDVEAIFFYPWGAVFRELGWYGFGAMFVFTIPLAVGLLYEYMKGGLEW